MKMKESPEELSVAKIKEELNKKNYEDIIKLTRNIFKTGESVNDFFLKARFFSLLQFEKYSQVIGETHLLIKNDDNNKQDFKNYFIENYTIIKNKNILFEFFYSMYKLGQYKKLNCCLNYFLEKETKYEDYIIILSAQTNYYLGDFDKCIQVYEQLLHDKDKQTLTTINLCSSYISAYIKLLNEYQFFKRGKSPNVKNIELKDLEILKEKIKKVTKNFKYEETDKYETLLNYAIFFTIEKNYEEALRLLDFAENVCRKELKDDELTIIQVDQIQNDEIRWKLWNLEFQKAYIYSKTNRVKEAVTIYENILNSCGKDKIINFNLIALSYNNYMSLKSIYGNLNNNMITEEKKAIDISAFNINNEKLAELKASLFFKKYVCTHLTVNNQIIFDINDCLISLINDEEKDFQTKFNILVTKYNDCILLDKIKIMMLKKKSSYEKCKSYIFNIIDKIYSVEEKINFINAFVTLCFEKKNYKAIIKIYTEWETLFQMHYKYYSIYFSNLFYIYICTNYSEQSKEQSKEGNLLLVVNLFQKYKACIKNNVQIINYETLFLVSKYLIYHKKEELLNDVLDFLCDEIKSDVEFFSFVTYIYTYINIKDAYKYEDKLKKAVLSETYLIDIEELENRNITLDITRSMELNSLENAKAQKKRKRKKRKHITRNINTANYDPNRWLSKREKTTYKKKKKKAKKDTSAPTMVPKGTGEDIKSQLNTNVNVSDKLKNLKSRKKR